MTTYNLMLLGGVSIDIQGADDIAQVVKELSASRWLITKSGEAVNVNQAIALVRSKAGEEQAAEQTLDLREPAEEKEADV